MIGNAATQVVAGWVRQHIGSRRFSRDRSGVTALETALLLPPFLGILMAILETGFMFLSAIIVEGATAEAARQVRTGFVQQSGAPIGQFRQILCDNLFGVVPCADLSVDVRNYTQFQDADVSANVDGAAFAPGNPGDVIVVRVSYDWEFITPFLELAVGQATPDSRTFISNAAFRNEPFEGALP